MTVRLGHISALTIEPCFPELTCDLTRGQRFTSFGLAIVASLISYSDISLMGCWKCDTQGIPQFETITTLALCMPEARDDGLQHPTFVEHKFSPSTSCQATTHSFALRLMSGTSLYVNREGYLEQVTKTEMIHQQHETSQARHRRATRI